jgi:tRNA (cytidine/uridine-2'-O-)-methyltransferase
MFHVVMLEPQIPPNTGNIIRLCANSGVRLHLVGPLGFTLDEPRLRRAGLDYHEWAEVEQHSSLHACLATLPETTRVLAFSTRGARSYAEVRYRAGDALLFGAETSGLPQSVLDGLPPEQRLCIPMRPGVRSLNLSNAVAVAVYEAWRQLGFDGAGRA